MKIFTGEQPKNPCDTCSDSVVKDGKVIPCRGEGCNQLRDFRGQLSILNQCVEVDIDAMLKMYHPKCFHKRLGSADGGKTFIEIPFSQFIQSEIMKQEGKDD